jgi:hypothetical protein
MDLLGFSKQVRVTPEEREGNSNSVASGSIASRNPGRISSLVEWQAAESWHWFSVAAAAA